ncbi:translation initiation factor IF-1, putative [Hepatocystis sp. ex Piliocolobus tephrosceles]|nr:translation initiation factor IF-1, putative [Hepatocystis sp. ex Piliocolobus tephrosceles]
MYDKISFSFLFFCLLLLINFTNEININNKFFIISVNNNRTTWMSNGTTLTRLQKYCNNDNVKRLNLIYNNAKKKLTQEKKNDIIEMNGVVHECLGNTNFIVQIPNNEKFLCFISGKLRINKVKINLGDHVKIQIHKLNFEQRKGKIVFRYLQQTPQKNKK